MESARPFFIQGKQVHLHGNSLIRKVKDLTLRQTGKASAKSTTFTQQWLAALESRFVFMADLSSLELRYLLVIAGWLVRTRKRFWERNFSPAFCMRLGTLWRLSSAIAPESQCSIEANIQNLSLLFRQKLRACSTACAARCGCTSPALGNGSLEKSTVRLETRAHIE